MRNLIIAAHPDDEVLGVGGSMARFAGREEFHVLILTDGGAGRYDQAATRRLREAALEAGALLGAAGTAFGDFPNQGLETVRLTSVAAFIEDHIRRLRPERLFVHSQNDLNLDHAVAHRAAVTAARSMPGQIVKEIHAFFTASSSDWSLEPEALHWNTFIDIDGALDAKIAAMALYESEARPFPHPRSPEALRAQAQFFGAMAGLKAAEPFRLLRRVGGWE